MATQGTPSAGLDLIATRVFVDGADYSLVAYTNTADSLGTATVAADLTQPTGGGYAPITLNGTWSSSGGVVTYSHPGNPYWIASGTWSADVTGVAIIYGSVVQHFKDLDTPFVAAANKKLEVDLSTVTG